MRPQRPATRHPYRLLLAALLLAAPACGVANDAPAVQPPDGVTGPPDTASGPGPTPSDTIPATLVDPNIPSAVAGDDGWMYRVIAGADLDGDTVEERVVLTARVELVDGRPAWDDGQPWQVYVEEPDGTRTRVYARFVQLGTVTMRVGLAGEETPASIVLLEHVPDLLSVYEAHYRGPDEVAAYVRYQRRVDPRGEPASPRLP